MSDRELASSGVVRPSPSTVAAASALTVGWAIPLTWIPLPAWIMWAVTALLIAAIVWSGARRAGAGSLCGAAFLALMLSAAGWGLIVRAMLAMEPSQQISYMANTQWDFLGHAIMTDEILRGGSFLTNAFGDPDFPFNDYPQGSAAASAFVMRPMVWLGLLQPSTAAAAAWAICIPLVGAAWMLALPVVGQLRSPSIGVRHMFVGLVLFGATMAVGPFAVLVGYGHVNFLVAVGILALMYQVAVGLRSEAPRSLVGTAVAIAGGLIAVCYTYPLMSIPALVLGGTSLVPLVRGASPRKLITASLTLATAAVLCIPPALMTWDAVDRFVSTNAGFGVPVTLAALMSCGVALTLGDRLTRNARQAVLWSGLGLLALVLILQTTSVGQPGYYAAKTGWGVALLVAVVASATPVEPRARVVPAAILASMVVFGASGPMTPFVDSAQAAAARPNLGYLGSAPYPRWPGNMLLSCAHSLDGRVEPVVVARLPGGHPRDDILTGWMAFLRGNASNVIWRATRTRSQVESRGYSVTDSLAYSLANEPELAAIASSDFAERMDRENPALVERRIATWIEDGGVTCTAARQR